MDASDCCYATDVKKITSKDNAKKADDSSLDFRDFSLDEINSITQLLLGAPARSCDFTIGGIYLWIDYLRYQRAIKDNTLFMKGMSELDLATPAFSLPIGDLPLHKSVNMLRDYAAAHGMPCRLTAVPEDVIPSLESMGGRVVAELNDWEDYLYEIIPMSTFAGKKMSKKRNHVNAFATAHPDHKFQPLTPDLLPAVKAFQESLELGDDKGTTAEVDRRMTLEVLDNMDAYAFEGAVLSTPDEGIVAFTLGEVRDDTLYVHIEKMRHDINGAGETVARDYAAMMLERYPELKYVNREDDAGDEGLRKAKLSYHPAQVLRKFDVVFD